ncbi:MAG: hypothetical protein ACOC1K_00550 [Nanoarchaeota archaeon]
MNIQSLEEKYLKAKIAYYEGNPFLTDSEFDSLEEELKNKGSKVIYQVGSKRKDFDIPHPTPMKSLAKIQTELTSEGKDIKKEDIDKWYNKRTKQLGKKVPLLSSPKFDGNAINIIYRGNKLSSILTRGDGKSGKDITERLKSKVPETLTINMLGNDLFSTDDIIEIRCEVVISLEIFNKKYSEKFANARNYVAGVLGKDDYDEEKVSELKIIPLIFLVNGVHVPQDHFTSNSVFHTNWNWNLDVEEYETRFSFYEKNREELDYQLDGIVFSFPTEYRKQLGENDHDPEWSIAVKFIPKDVVAEVEGIEWNISKRGEIFPVILLKPTLLDGTIVKRASGYNLGYLLKNKIGYGAKVTIAKAGDIIPEVQRVVVESEEITQPETCPYCYSELSFDGVHIRCTNETCVGKIRKQLATSIGVLDLQRIGSKTIEPFAGDFINMFEVIRFVKEEGNTHKIEKYGLKKGSRSHEIFLDAFNNIRSLTYEQVIQMLGYENVGKKLSTQLAREHEGLDYNYAHLEKALVAKLRSEDISNYIKEVVSYLESLGILVERPKKETKDETIGVCLTGSPKSFGFKTKKEFLAEFCNLKEVSLSDSNCKCLITDDLNSISSKMKTAQKKGIEIKTYGDF